MSLEPNIWLSGPKIPEIEVSNATRELLALIAIAKGEKKESPNEPLADAKIPALMLSTLDLYLSSAILGVSFLTIFFHYRNDKGINKIVDYCLSL
jgi:hypothetical protein